MQGQLPYPVKILFKSSKPVVTLLMSSKVFRRDYASNELVRVSLMVSGLILFSLAGSKSAGNSSPDVNPFGVCYTALRYDICSAILLQ